MCISRLLQRRGSFFLSLLAHDHALLDQLRLAEGDICPALFHVDAAAAEDRHDPSQFASSPKSAVLTRLDLATALAARRASTGFFALAR